MELSLSWSFCTSRVTSYHRKYSTMTSYTHVCLRFLWWNMTHSVYRNYDRCYCLICYIQRSMIYAWKTLWWMIFQDVWYVGRDTRNWAQVYEKICKHLGTRRNNTLKISSTLSYIYAFYSWKYGASFKKVLGI